MQAIILAGGFGTRLKPLVSDVPKSMAPVAGVPFLDRLLRYMEGQGVTEALLCLHHMPEHIRSYFGPRFGEMTLTYAIEQTPLGTGGALRNALTQLNPNAPVLALNGDSLVMADYRRMMEFHRQQKRPMTMAVARMEDCRRYGALRVAHHRVTGFNAQGGAGAGFINAGLYVLSPGVLSGCSGAFSLERDFLAPHAPTLQPAAYSHVQGFIDIGVPGDYSAAQTLVPEFLARAA